MVVTLTLALISIVINTVGQAIIKHGVNRSSGIQLTLNEFIPSMKSALLDPIVGLGLFLIMLTIPSWVYVLSKLPLSVAAPMVSIGYVISILIGYLVFKEAITPFRIIGVVLIILGVIAISSTVNINPTIKH